MKNDVPVRSMFDKMVFDSLLLDSWYRFNLQYKQFHFQLQCYFSSGDTPGPYFYHSSSEKSLFQQQDLSTRFHARSWPSKSWVSKQTRPINSVHWVTRMKSRNKIETSDKTEIDDHCNKTYFRSHEVQICGLEWADVVVFFKHDPTFFH